MPRVTVRHAACGGTIEVQAGDLVRQDPPVIYTCPRCGVDIQVSN